MTATFLGKWRLRLSNVNGYLSYKPNPGRKNAIDHVLCVWFVNGEGGPFPPGMETNIAFILRDDSKLCFLMNSGHYVADAVGFVKTLAKASGFAFPGHDHRNLPAHFDSKLQTLPDGTFLYELRGIFIPGVIESAGQSFTVSQVTPSLASVQASRNGDGLDFAWLDLTGVKLANCTLKNAVFDNCAVKGLDISGSTLAGASLNQLDLTGVVADPPAHFHTAPLKPPAPDNRRTTFLGSRLDQSLLGSDWSMLDLTGATVLNLPTPLSTPEKPLQANYSLLAGLNQNNLSGLTLKSAVFDNAVLDGVNLNDSDLTGASFIQASMHGAVLSNATLKGANMAGAQLGTLNRLFTLGPDFVKDLDGGPNVSASLRQQFSLHGIALSPSASLGTQAAGRVWQLNDVGNRVVYTARMETQGDSSHALAVYKPAVAASLVNAYMPDAVLTGANLYGITANNIQFYGSKAKVDGSAILEEAKLNSSNLSTVNFTQAQLLGANLSNSHLFNAKFNKANLSASASGGAADLSDANLQGADFTDAQLYGANLTNAAVAVNVPTKANPRQGGVYLFSLPFKGDGNTLQQYAAELDAASTFFSLNPGGDQTALNKFLTALKTNTVGPLKLAFLKHQPPVVLSNSAQIQTVEPDAVWQIVDGAHGYTLWTGPDEQGKTELYAAPSMTRTQAAFKRSSLPLRWQASVAVDAAGQQWLIDNDSENPQNFSTGYVKFLLKLRGGVLNVYGTALRVLRLGDHNQEEFDTETCNVTQLVLTNMNADTVCPNGSTLKVNQSRSGKTWDELWLRAATPPKPPACVPTDYNWCPPPPSKKKRGDGDGS